MIKHISTRLVAVVGLCLMAGCSNMKDRAIGDSAGIDLLHARCEIIIPDKPLPVEKYAADELQYHIEKATGVTLTILPESQSTTNCIHIYLGGCKQTKQRGIDASTLEANARIIRTVGSDLFIAGRDSDGPVLRHFHANSTRCGTLFGVYDFLEKELGVRWLWPGELGEHIPQTATLLTGKWNETVLPKLKHSRLRSVGGIAGRRWPTQEVSNRYYHHVLPQWMRRQRFSQAISLEYGHAFIKYWDRFGKTNPEFFALKPNGKREPTGAPALVQMCVSNEGFQEQVVADWLVKRKKWDADTQGPLMVNGCENDRRTIDPSCTCSACTAWDAEHAAVLNEQSADLIASGDAGASHEGRHSLSDRYAKFYLALQEKARLHDPVARVVALAYADYLLAPLETKLNRNVFIGVTFPTDTFFPVDEVKKKDLLDLWDGWGEAGASLFFRPNALLRSGTLPIYFADEMGRLFSHCYKNGMVATDFDALTGQWAVQGPSLYVTARIQEHPDWSAEKILDEYYSAFGTAELAVRDYFQYWKRISQAVTREQIQQAVQETGAHSWREVFRFTGDIFTPKVIGKGEAILARAETLSAEAPLDLQRVQFLQKGLRNVRLMMEAQAAFVQYKEKGDLNSFAAVLEELDSFRLSVEGEFVADMGYCYWSEAVWSRDLVKMQGKGGKDLPDSWKFMWDPENKGEGDNWQSEAFDDEAWAGIGVDDVWEKQAVGKQWAVAHNGAGYNGLAWYRNTFTVKPTDPPKRYTLGFGAVDEACVVWVNGKKVLTRPYPYKGDRESWQAPFEVDITKYIHSDRPNVLAVRVEDSSGAGGIWKGVQLIVTDALADAVLNMLKNPGFESGQKPWNKSVMAGKWNFAIDEVAHSGNNSARLECTQVAPHNSAPQKPNSWGRWYQTIPVKNGEKYSFRCFVKTEPKFTGKVQVLFTGDVAKRTQVVESITTQGLWRELKINNFVAAGDQASIYLNQYGLGKVWFDDVEVTKAQISAYK